jgi:hypothetical protein
MTDLSPDALAVICAAQAAEQDDISSIVAAAIRAVADQVVPHIETPIGSREGERQCVRREILAIVNELESAP